MNGNNRVQLIESNEPSKMFNSKSLSLSLSLSFSYYHNHPTTVFTTIHWILFTNKSISANQPVIWLMMIDWNGQFCDMERKWHSTVVQRYYSSSQINVVLNNRSFNNLKLKNQLVVVSINKKGKNPENNFRFKHISQFWK